ncbi:MAG: hypothetical protein SVX38_05165 [Chloroflexota bacterium]|nr:hypothetical protein [Chloroflexota bacterium]
MKNVEKGLCTKTERWRPSVLAGLMALLLVLTSCLLREPPPPPATPPADCRPTSEALTLDQGWRFRTDPDDLGLAQNWQSPEFDDSDWQILTPGEPWEFSGLEYDGVAWYRTQITLPDWPAVYLGFGGVDDVATLWVNSTRVATWETLGERAAFLDLLEFGEVGSEVHLAFRVEDQGGYGGLKQPLRLGTKPSLVMTDAQHVIQLADSHPAWPMPGWAQGRPFTWTMTGQRDAAEETLISADGAVAPWATAPTVEVWLHDPTGGELAAGAQHGIHFSLANDHLPIPQSEWTALDMTLKGVVFHDARDSAVRWLVTAHNTSDSKRELTLLVAVRPFAVNRAAAPVYAIGLQGETRLWVNGEPFMIAATPPAESGVGLLDEAMAAATQGQSPAGEAIACAPAGDAAAVWAYPLQLDAGQSTSFHFAFPAAPGDPFPTADADARARLAETIVAWEEATGRVTVKLPDQLVEAGVPASVGYLLLALDPEGPHPGPLAHDALWARDAAYIGSALLQFGHADAVRAYIPKVFAAQEADGRVPPIQGENIPWDDDEWDAQGQAIFLVTSYHRYTGDEDTLREWYPALRAAARFIVELRASHTDVEGPARGLLPPSKSAEDIGPPDWHHYWDNFWAVAGLEEAAYAARELGEADDAIWMQAEADSLREAILASIESVMGPEPAYIPSAVENVQGSAMARGNVPALWPVEVLPREMSLLARSFEYYYQHWIAPYEGGFLHREGQFWTYGGLELAHVYLRLGRMDVLHQILAWTLSHQTLPGTFAWAEQVSPANGSFSGGDMPHAWAAASYATLVREMLISERGDALELFTGVPDWWFGDGQVIALENAPTHFGVLDLRTESTVEQTDAGWHGTLTLALSGATPPDGFRWRLLRTPAIVDGPPGTMVDDGWLVVPGEEGTIRLTFGSQ